MQNVIARRIDFSVKYSLKPESMLCVLFITRFTTVFFIQSADTFGKTTAKARFQSSLI